MDSQKLTSDSATNNEDNNSNNNTTNSDEKDKPDRLITINVKTLSAKVYTLTVKRNISVPELKQKLAELSGMNVDTQRLIFQGKVLADEKRLLDYGVDHEQTLHLVERKPPPLTSSATPSSPSGTAASTTAAPPSSSAGGTAHRRHFVAIPNIVMGTITIPGDESVVPNLNQLIGNVLQTLSQSRVASQPPVSQPSNVTASASASSPSQPQTSSQLHGASSPSTSSTSTTGPDAGRGGVFVNAGIPLADRLSQIEQLLTTLERALDGLTSVQSNSSATATSASLLERTRALFARVSGLLTPLSSPDVPRVQRIQHILHHVSILCSLLSPSLPSLLQQSSATSTTVPASATSSSSVSSPSPVRTYSHITTLPEGGVMQVIQVVQQDTATSPAPESTPSSSSSSSLSASASTATPTSTTSSPAPVHMNVPFFTIRQHPPSSSPNSTAPSAPTSAASAPPSLPLNIPTLIAQTITSLLQQSTALTSSSAPSLFATTADATSTSSSSRVSTSLDTPAATSPQGPPAPSRTTTVSAPTPLPSNVSPTVASSSPPTLSSLPTAPLAVPTNSLRSGPSASSIVPLLGPAIVGTDSVDTSGVLMTRLLALLTRGTRGENLSLAELLHFAPTSEASPLASVLRVALETLTVPDLLRLVQHGDWSPLDRLLRPLATHFRTVVGEFVNTQQQRPPQSSSTPSSDSLTPYIETILTNGESVVARDRLPPTLRGRLSSHANLQHVMRCVWEPYLRRVLTFVLASTDEPHTSLPSFAQFFRTHTERTLREWVAALEASFQGGVTDVSLFLRWLLTEHVFNFGSALPAEFGTIGSHLVTDYIMHLRTLSSAPVNTNRQQDGVSQLTSSGLPAEWEPVVARDMQRQERNPRQAPSDEYLLGQPGPRSKKRRLNEEQQQITKMPIPDASLTPQVLLERSLRRALECVSQPTTLASSLAASPLASLWLLQLQRDIRTRLQHDPDFAVVYDRFPHTCAQFLGGPS
jgi:hypothetical protein